MRAGVTARVARPRDTPLDGAFHAWANPASDDPESGAYPFVFDTPDQALYRDLALPAIRNVQLAAFAHELHAYANEEEYYAAQGEAKFAVESFIPAGLCTPEGDTIDPPNAHAILSGRVLETSLLTNSATGNGFHWARAHTLLGEVDVVSDPEIVQGTLVRSGIVRGWFWLSGRLLG